MMVKTILFVVLVHCVLSLTSADHERHQYKATFQKRSSVNNPQAEQGVQRDEQLSPVNILDPEQAGHMIPHAPSSSSENKIVMLNGKAMDSQVLKLMLKNLLSRLESPRKNVSSSSSSTNHQQTPVKGGPRRIRSTKRRHCNLHGLWLSTVAGAAIELLPVRKEHGQHGHIEIFTKIFELPDNPFPSVINSRWTGKGMISPESPTTITIIFQEHIDAEAENHAKERGAGGEKDSSSVFVQLPRTAVFVGQCLICQGNPMLQGSWLIFPVTQACNVGKRLTPISQDEFGSIEPVRLKEPNIPDSMYLLRY